MSQNVEIVKRVIDAYNRGDLDAIDELCSPDFEWSTVMGAVEVETFRGRAGVERYYEALDDAWEEFRVVAEELRELGERVLVLGRFQGRGRGSGVPVDSPVGIIYDLRGGKASRVRSYLDHGEALRAAGLSE